MTTTKHKNVSTSIDTFGIERAIVRTVDQLTDVCDWLPADRKLDIIIVGHKGDNYHNSLCFHMLSIVQCGRVRSVDIGPSAVDCFESLFGINKVGHISYIVNLHLEDKDVLMCQDELIDAGFAEIAKL